LSGFLQQDFKDLDRLPLRLQPDAIFTQLPVGRGRLC
jgi:hypothetical protein